MPNDDNKPAAAAPAAPQPGLGRPLFKSLIFPALDANGNLAGAEGGAIAALGMKPGVPVFEVLTFPYVPPDEKE